jgi:shikimate kinase
MSNSNTKKEEEVDQGRVEECREWMEKVLGQKIKGDFFEAIKDGVLLCEIANCIQADICKKYKKSDVAFVCRTNIQIYLEACKKIGCTSNRLL